METLKNWWRGANHLLWLLSLAIGLVMTWLVNVVPAVTAVVRVGLVYCLLNAAFAVWTGWALRDRPRGWQLLVFPCSYLIGSSLFGAQYSLFFAPAYLALAYLTWSMIRTSHK